MHHAALNGARPHDGDFNHEIVKAPWLQARQHRHLRPALDLENADRVGAADHIVGRGVFGRNRGQRPVDSVMLGDQIEGLVNGRQHAEGEAIHLENAERVEIVLVPLDDGAVGHGGVLDGHRWAPVPRAGRA